MDRDRFSTFSWRTATNLRGRGRGSKNHESNEKEYGNLSEDTLDWSRDTGDLDISS
jgi:hypothetical protein